MTSGEHVPHLVPAKSHLQRRNIVQVAHLNPSNFQLPFSQAACAEREVMPQSEKMEGKPTVNLRQVGAYALLANAAIGVVLTIAAITANGDTPTAIVIIQLLGFLLFIVGLPAIWLSQPQTGRQGQVGLALLGLGSAIAFIVVLLSLVGGSFPDAAPFASALAACLGSILVGWQTVQARVFPAGIGWLLLATGVLNFADGYLPASTFATIFAITLGLASVVTRIGYGWLILKRPQLAYQASVAI